MYTRRSDADHIVKISHNSARDHNLEIRVRILAMVSGGIRRRIILISPNLEVHVMLGHFKCTKQVVYLEFHAP